MKNIFILFILCSSFYSCIPEKVRINPDKRVLISGKILFDNPTSIPVATFGAIDGNVNSSPYHKLGFSKTSLSGNINFISLDTRNGDLAVIINPEYEEGYREDYAILNFIDLADDHAVHIDLGNINLPLKKEFTISFENTSGTTNELRYNINYQNQKLYYLIIDGNVSGEVPENYQLRNSRAILGSHSISDGITSVKLFTVEDSEITIAYTLGIEDPREILIPVTSQTSSHVFEY